MSDPKNHKRWSERSPYHAAIDDDAGRGDRHDAPSARRNSDAILAVLAEVLPEARTVLEIGSGTGQHVVAFAAAHPGVTWQPSDPDPRARASVTAWVAEAGLDNVRPPAAIDAAAAGWHDAIDGPLDGIVCINVLHISPWSTCEGLIDGAAQLLRPDAPLYLYGPYMRGGEHTAPSNAEFDRSLRFRNPAWGVRDLDAVAARAAAAGLDLDRVVEMPANNLSVILRRRQGFPGTDELSNKRR